MNTPENPRPSVAEPNAREWEIAEEFFPMDPQLHTRAAAMLACYRAELLEPESARE